MADSHAELNILKIREALRARMEDLARRKAASPNLPPTPRPAGNWGSSAGVLSALPAAPASRAER